MIENNTNNLVQNNKGGLVTKIIIGLIIILAIVLVYYFIQYRNLNKAKAGGLTNSEIQSLVDKVGKIIDLPKGEIPTVATVSDVTKLSGQPFFEKAKNGDQVLFYTESKKAFIYDPVQNVIVEVASLSVGK